MLKVWTELRAFLLGAMKYRFSRFLISGGFNTVVTYIIYLLLLMVASYKVSYTAAYLFGIFLAFFMNRYFVFKSHKGLRSIAFFPFVYLVQYIVSMLCLWLWIEQLGWNEEVAPLVAIAITVPLTYVLSRFVFVK